VTLIPHQVRLPLPDEQRLEADLGTGLAEPGSYAAFELESGHGDTPGEKGADGGRPGRADETDGRVLHDAVAAPSAGVREHVL
jgi:hypothetical protein